MRKIRIKKLTETATIPQYQTKGAAGCDLHADIPEAITIRPHETVMIPSNIAMEIPEGYFAGVFPRSGISTREGLRLANCVGVIDSDYRNGIGLPMHNDTENDQVVYPNERVAQLIFIPYARLGFKEVDKLTETERGLSGFGSTGR